MPSTPDLTPVTDAIAGLLPGVNNHQLDARTPCEKWTTRELLAHLDGLTQAFRAAAAKDFGPLTDTPPADAALGLAADWRHKLPAQLSALATAWTDPTATEGMTRAGGVEMPAEVMGCVVTNELVLHGWDLAQATGQGFDPAPPAVAHALAFVEQVGDEPEQRQGLFGPRVSTDDDAPLDRLLAGAGRDPRWQA